MPQFKMSEKYNWILIQIIVIITITCECYNLKCMQGILKSEKIMVAFLQFM